MQDCGVMCFLDIPRIRGVEPEPVAIENDADKYSPHTRGWTYVQIYEFKSAEDIPRIRGVEPV